MQHLRRELVAAECGIKRRRMLARFICHGLPLCAYADISRHVAAVVTRDSFSDCTSPEMKHCQR